MKPIKSYAGSIEGDLGGYEIQMDFDDTPEGRLHLLSVLTDLYSDPEMAVLREYSTNALDAQIEAGYTGPIEVTLPSALSPRLVITDHGPGLSVNDMERIYSKYGASTKRGSDAVTGMLGLGGKSALTYTSQFSIKSVKNGVQTDVVVTRNEDGVGVMEVVDTRSTTESNGTTITIPTKHGNTFAKKAEELFFFWQPGTVLVNGSQPKHLVTEDGIPRVAGAYVVPQNRWGRSTYPYSFDTDVVVMGNVPYPLPDKRISTGFTRDYWSTFVVFVPMGSVTFAPSREALAFTPKTVHAIDNIIANITANLTAEIQNQIDSCKTHSDAMRLFSKWNASISNIPKTITYKGTTFDTLQFKARNFMWIREGGRYNWQTRKAANTIKAEDGGHVETLLQDGIAIVTGYPNTSAPSGAHKQRLNIFADKMNVNRIILLERMVGAPWTDNIKTYDWNTDIASIKIGSGGVNRRGPIPVVKASVSANCVKWENVTVTLDVNEPIIITGPNDDSCNDGRVLVILAEFPGAQIISLGANRWAKFKRENPTAQTVNEFWRNVFIPHLEKSLNADEKLAATMGYNDQRFARAYAGKGIVFDDPELNEILRIGAHLDTSPVKRYNRIIGANPRNDYTDNYPLIDIGYQPNRPNRKHSKIYADAVYAQKGK